MKQSDLPIPKNPQVIDEITNQSPQSLTLHIQNERACAVERILGKQNQNMPVAHYEDMIDNNPENLSSSLKNDESKEIRNTHTHQSENQGVKLIKYLDVPKYLDNKDPHSIFRFLRTKISRTSMEKSCMTILLGFFSLTTAITTIHIDTAILFSLHLTQEAFVLRNFISLDSRFMGYEILDGLILLAVIGVGLTVVTSQLGTRLNLGRYSIIDLDYKSRSAGYHIQRNLIHLHETSGDGGQLLKILKELKKTLPKIVDTLYDSGKIEEIDTIVLNSYLLTHKSLYDKLYSGLQKLVPFATITEIPIAPMHPYDIGALHAEFIRLNWVQKLHSYNMITRKIFNPIIRSEKFTPATLFVAGVWHQLVGFEGLRKLLGRPPDTPTNVSIPITHTRGFRIVLPKERPEGY